MDDSKPYQIQFQELLTKFMTSRISNRKIIVPVSFLIKLQVFLNKVAGLSLHIYQKRDSGIGVFL